MARNINFNEESAKAGSGGTSNRVDASGAYVGTIKRAECVKLPTGTEGVELDFTTEAGQQATRMMLYTYNKDGKEIYGFKQLQAIMRVAGTKNLTASIVEVEKYDFDQGAVTKTQAECYSDLHGKKIGFVLQRENYKTSKGNDAYQLNIVAPFKHDTRQTAEELIDNKPAAIVDKISSAIKDATRQQNSENPAPHNASSSFNASDDQWD